MSIKLDSCRYIDENKNDKNRDIEREVRLKYIPI